MTPAGDGQFPTTKWTLIARLKSGDEAEAARALDEICAQYHYPLYCYLRRRNCGHHDAQDVLHDFLARLLQHRALERADEELGRLRGYLATALGRHLQRWRESAARQPDSAQKAGGMLDFQAIEERYQHERFADSDSPDRIFERQWAIELLHRAIAKLADRYEKKGKTSLFTALRPVLERGGSLRGEDSPALAAQLGLSPTALRVALSRSLDELAELIQAEVRLTVEDPKEVPDELAYLMRLFRQG
jgi:RNA polymerase sigma factor (sigma-70 family)